MFVLRRIGPNTPDWVIYDSRDDALHDGQRDNWEWTKLELPKDELETKAMAILNDGDFGCNYLFGFDEKSVLNEVLLQKLVENDDPSLASSTQAVLTVNKNLERIYLLNLRNTVVQHLCGKRAGYWIFWYFKKFSVPTASISVVMTTSTALHIYEPSFREFFSPLSSRVLYALALVSHLVLFVGWFPTCNYALLRGVLRQFEALYIIGIGFVSAVCFLVSLGAWRGVVAGITFQFLSIFIGCSDALHPGIRVNKGGFLGVCTVMICLFFLFIYYGYFHGSHLEEPVNRTPILVWEIMTANGESNKHVIIELYPEMVAMECATSLILWCTYVVFRVAAKPNQLNLLKPPVYLHRLTQEEIRQFVESDRLKHRRCEQLSTVPKYEQAFDKGQGKVAPTNCLNEHLQHRSEEKFEIFFQNQLGLRIMQATKSQRSAEFSVLIEGNVVRTMAPMGCNSSNKRIRLLSLTGTFANDAFVIDPRNTLGKAVLGAKFMNAYFQFSKRSHHVAILSFIVLVTGYLAVLHVFSNSFRERTGYMFAPAVGIVSVAMLLIDVHSLLFCNLHLLKLVLNEFQTYYIIYLAGTGFGSLGLILGDDEARNGHRRLMMLVMCSHSIFGYAFHDAHHPFARTKRMLLIQTLLTFLGHTSVTIGCLAAFNQLAQPMTVDPLFTVNVTSTFNIQFNLATMAITKLTIMQLFTFRNIVNLLFDPNRLHIIRARLRIYNTTKADYGSLVERVRSKRVSSNAESKGLCSVQRFSNVRPRPSLER